jgi:hypothetical protein
MVEPKEYILQKESPGISRRDGRIMDASGYPSIECSNDLQRNDTASILSMSQNQSDVLCFDHRKLSLRKTRNVSRSTVGIPVWPSSDIDEMKDLIS